MLRAQAKSAGGDVSGRHVRTTWSLPLFATVSSLAFVLVSLVSPEAPASAVVFTPSRALANEQVLAVGEGSGTTVVRDAFETSTIRVVSAAPAAGIPDPGSAQAIAYDLLVSMGLGNDEYSCLVALWDRESHWNVYAYNASSGAYGIPQALPGNKMASAGSDWATSAKTQIIWGLGYIQARYGSPCGAWTHSEESGWY